MKTHNRKKTRRKSSWKKINGGKVIASGGFGCVFSPALKCQGEDSREANKISKLMTRKHAMEEYHEIEIIRQKLESIPNYGNYFLLSGINLCEPASLEPEDLKSFQGKCSALPKDGITSKNINETANLSKVLSLNMPNGGITIEEYLLANFSHLDIVRLNNKMIILLNKGIIHMNSKHIYHCDIKDSNILVDSSVTPRLIDWGLSTEYIPNKESSFPSTWRNRPLQFNVPFSVILFTDTFVRSYTEYIRAGGKTDKDSLKPFVVDYICLWMQERGSGHYKYINNIMYMLFGRELRNVKSEDTKAKLIESEFTMPYISNYLVEVLIHYTKFRKNGTLNLRIYLDNVFVKIVDIWGFVIAYTPILEILFENYDTSSEMDQLLFDALKDIFIKYLYTPRSTIINVGELTTDLRHLNTLITRRSSPSLSKNKSKTMKITSSIKSDSIASRHDNLLLLSISSETSKKKSKKNKKAKQKSLENSVSELKETITKK
jgi:serine/threonine protein kinase